MDRYPVGGPRQPVYDLMRGLGFSMERSGDKHWTSADGIEVHIYGAGSMARVSHGQRRGECKLDELSAYIDSIRLNAIAARAMT